MRNIHGIFQKAEYFIAWYALIFCLALTMKKLKTYKEANAYRFFIMRNRKTSFILDINDGKQLFIVDTIRL